MNTIKTKEQLKDAVKHAYGYLYIINGNDMFDGDFDECCDWDDYLDEVVEVTEKEILENDETGNLPYRVHRFMEYLDEEEWKRTNFYLLKHDTGYNEENQDAVFAITYK